MGISLLLHSYIWRAGVVLTVLWLGQQQGDLVNGVLYGPLRAVQQVRIIPAAFAAAMLPVFSDRAASRMDEFDTAFAKTIKLFTAISLLIALAFTFLADPMVKLLLGDDDRSLYGRAVLAWLGWVIVLIFPNWLYSVTWSRWAGRSWRRWAWLGSGGRFPGGLVGHPPLPGHGRGLRHSGGRGRASSSWARSAMRRHFHWRQLAPSLSKVILACALAGGSSWPAAGCGQG